MEQLVERGSGEFGRGSLNWIQTWTLIWATVFYSVFPIFFFWVCSIVEMNGYTDRKSVV